MFQIDGAVGKLARGFVVYAVFAARGCLQLVCEVGFASESGLCKAQTAARLDTLRGFATRQSTAYDVKTAAIPIANSP